MNVDKIEHYLTIGQRDRYWYQRQQEVFIKLFGEYNLKLVCQIFAATSINTSLESNIRLFRKAYHQLTNNLPYTNYLPVMLLQLERIRRGEPIQGRKIVSFSNAMAGDENAVVVDIWLLRAFGMYQQSVRTYTIKNAVRQRPRSNSANDTQYTMIENFCRFYAKANNMQAREVSAMIWSGCRTVWAGKKETNYKEILEHQLYNMYETR